jgi:predicted HicB family RNase H-like nuclease
MEQKPKRPRGAPPKENPASGRFEVRCTSDQKQRWSAAAQKFGFSSLAAWLKHLADKNA